MGTFLIAHPYVLVIDNRKKLVILPSIDKPSPKKLIHNGRHQDWQMTLTFPESLKYLPEILKITPAGKH